MTLELSASLHRDEQENPDDHDGATFYLTLQSGSSEYGFYSRSISGPTVTTASVTDKKWHHYAVTILTASQGNEDETHGTEIKFYVDGKLNKW